MRGHVSPTRCRDRSGRKGLAGMWGRHIWGLPSHIIPGCHTPRAGSDTRTGREGLGQLGRKQGLPKVLTSPHNPELQEGGWGAHFPATPWPWQQGPQGHPHAAGDGAESGDMALLQGLALDVPLPLSLLAQPPPGWQHPPGLGLLEPVEPLTGSAPSTRVWHSAPEVGRAGDAWSGPDCCCCMEPSPSPSGGTTSPARTIFPRRNNPS